MSLKTISLTVVLLVVGVVASSFFVGEVLMTQVTPFQSIQNSGATPRADELGLVEFRGNNSVRFANQDLLTGWVPWIIRQVSILVGAISLVVFVYAGIRLVLFGDNEEEFGKSVKTIVFAVIGIALAAFSYAIVANVLALFSQTT